MESKIKENIEKVLNENKTNETTNKNDSAIELTKLSEQQKKDLHLESDDLKINSTDVAAANFGMGFVNATLNAVTKKEDNQQFEFKQTDQFKDKKNFKFDYSAITLNPIKNFYYHISQSIDEILNDYFEDEFLNNNSNLKRINELTKQINEDQKAIADKRNELRVNYRYAQNSLITFSFFLIIGLAFISIYKKNNAIINQFEEFKKEKEKLINENTYKRFSLIYYALSNVILKDIYEYVFNRYGIDISEKIPSKKILKFLNDPNIVDVYTGISGRYKNTPFFDIIYRTHVWEEVITERTGSFPYVEQVSSLDSDGNTVITTKVSYETVTAYHKELTPFIYKTNWLMTLTNYDQNFSFRLSPNLESQKNRKLENKNFLQKYNISVNDVCDLKQKDGLFEDQKVAEVFTIKAQEDFVHWYDVNNGQVFNFDKFYNTLIVQNKDYRIDNLDSLNKLLINVGLIRYDKNIGLEEIKQNIKNYVFSYFEKFTKMFQTPLLLPAINREWFTKEGGTYQIGNEYEKPEYWQDKEEFDEIYVINRMFQNNLLWFNTPKTPDKPIWFKLNRKTNGKNNIIHYEYFMNSYWSTILVDNTRVYGNRVGYQVVPVPYRKFFQMKELKYLSFLPFKNTDNKVIMVSKIFNKIIDSRQYSNQEISKLIDENFIWSNDPYWFENLKDVKKLISVFDRFNKLNESRQYIILIDEYGAYLISNDKRILYNQDLENILVDILKFFKQS